LLRTAEKEWYDVMRRQLRELKAVAQLCGDAPIVCAGDIVHRWQQPPELINFMLQELPDMYAVRGQHDLPYHSHDLIERSAYWSMVLARRITDISDKGVYLPNGGSPILIMGCAYPGEFGDASFSVKQHPAEAVKLAVVHRYCWMTGNSHVKALPRDNAGRQIELLKKCGFTAAVFGDNHKGFLKVQKGFHLFNSGTFIVRNSDEVGYTPQIGLLLKDGSIVPWMLDVSQDQYLEGLEDFDYIEAEQVGSKELAELIDQCESKADGRWDFREAVLTALKKTTKISLPVKAFILRALEDVSR